MAETSGTLVTVSVLTRTLPCEVSLFSFQVNLVQLWDVSAATCTYLSCAVDMRSNILSRFMGDWRRGMIW
jgi:hypothetical protein